uniref:sodium/potassium-transporting ATPase subunit beta-2-like n=1 Tax=Vespula vulgaris TaxID=7454 RepID=UPI00223C3FE4|nr:sodium/potassium-transporting ATPase subunit beta-2-like [Vespula vulgaris]
MENLQQRSAFHKVNTPDTTGRSWWLLSQDGGLLNVRSLLDDLRVLPTSLIIENPGIGYKPNIPLPLTSPIIWISETNKNARSKRYVQALTDFLKDYTMNSTQRELKCSEDQLRPYSKLKPCFFDVKSLGTCGKAPYGYTIPIQPCVLIKFNKRLGWIPHYYNRSSVLPRTMPNFLKKIIKKSDKVYIWLSCNGADNIDKEHIGKIEYIPNPGFPIEYFPFRGQKDYVSPVVAIKFKNLTPNRLLTVQCIVWSSNVIQPTSYYMDFQIIIGKELSLYSKNDRSNCRHHKE